jgi:large subunit ribosomal protein L35
VPKMKTKSGAKKRFRVTASGKVKRRRANHSHILTKKTSKRKRHLDSVALVNSVEEKRIKRLLAL